MRQPAGPVQRALLSLGLVVALGPGLSAAGAELLTTAEPLTLAELEASVERAYPALLAAQADQAAAEGELRAARGGFDPQWKTRFDVDAFGYYSGKRLDTVVEVPTPWWGTTVFGGYRLGVGKIPDYDGKLVTESGGEFRGGLRVPLLRDGSTDRRRVTLGRAELGREIAGLGVEQQRLEVLRIARQRYWDWQAAGRRLVLAEGLLQLARDRDAVLEARVRRGDLPSVERTENERAIAQRTAQVATARRGLEQAALELSLFLRDASGAPVLPGANRLGSSLPEPTRLPDPEADLPQALERRPEPQRLRLGLLQGQLELGLARNQVLPALDLSFFVAQDVGSFDPTRAATTGFLGVSLEVPLLGRQPLGRLDAARAGVRRLEAQLRLSRDRVTVEVRDAVSSVTAAATRIGAARREVELATELERLERKRFELGDSTLFFVNLREQATLEAQLRAVDALADYHKGMAAYAAATARAP